MSADQPINPYAASPSAGHEPRDSRARTSGAPLPWEPLEALAFGWRRTLQEPLCILVWFIASLAANVVSLIGAALQYTLIQSADPDQRQLGDLAYWVAQAINFPISIWIYAGLTRYSLAIARRDPRAGFGVAFGGGSFLSMAGSTLLLALGVGLGTLACIVPGVILALGWWLFGFFIVDRDAGPVSALTTSWSATKGNKGKLLLLALLFMLVAIAGLLALCVGIFVVYPVVQIALAYVYMKLTGEEPSSSVGVSG